MEHPVLGDIQEEGNLELDGTQSTSPVEETPEASTTPAVEDKPTEEPTVPFHEHPRFKEVISERDTFKTRVQELEEQITKLSSQSEPVAPAPTSANPQVPKEFVELYGTDSAEYWEAYKKLNQQVLDGVVRKDEMSQLVAQEIARIEQEKVEQADLTKKYAQEYEQKIQELSTKHQIDAGKFRKWFSDMAQSGSPIVRLDPENPANWEYDFDKGAEIFAQINPPADRGTVATTSDNAPTATPGRFNNINDLARTSWTSLN